MSESFPVQEDYIGPKPDDELDAINSAPVQTYAEAPTAVQGEDEFFPSGKKVNEYSLDLETGQIIRC